MNLSIFRTVFSRHFGGPGSLNWKLPNLGAGISFRDFHHFTGDRESPAIKVNFHIFGASEPSNQPNGNH